VSRRSSETERLRVELGVLRAAMDRLEKVTMVMMMMMMMVVVVVVAVVVMVVMMMMMMVMMMTSSLFAFLRRTSRLRSR
jgi:hypothetical protein